MELQGLIELFDYLDSQGIDVAAFVSDRHTQIAAYMRTTKETILHIFDIWHICKGMCCTFNVSLAIVYDW